MAMPLSLFSSLRMKLLMFTTAVFVSLMTYLGVRCSSLARCYGFATDEAADRLSLRHNVKKVYVCVVDMHFSYAVRLRYD